MLLIYNLKLLLNAFVTILRLVIKLTVPLDQPTLNYVHEHRL